MVTSELQRGALAIIVLFPALALLTVLLRLVSRFSLSLFGWDDLLVTAAMIISLGETYVSWMDIKTNYIGIHSYDIPPGMDPTLGLKYNYVAIVLYNPMLALVKISILVFLFRLSGNRRSINIAIWALIVLTVGLMVPMLIVLIFQCTPISAIWDLTLERHCIAQGPFYILQSIATILTDVLVLIIPYWIISGLSMPRQTKIAVISMFCLGLIVTFTSIVRLALLIKGIYFPTRQDPTYGIGFVTSAIETNLAIITASLPALKPLFKHWFPSIFGVDRFRNPCQLPINIVTASRPAGRCRSESIIHNNISFESVLVKDETNLDEHTKQDESEHHCC